MTREIRWSGRNWDFSSGILVRKSEYWPIHSSNTNFVHSVKTLMLSPRAEYEKWYLPIGQDVMTNHALENGCSQASLRSLARAV